MKINNIILKMKTKFIISTDGVKLIRNYFSVIAILLLFSYCTNIIESSNSDGKVKSDSLKLVYSNEFEENDNLNFWNGISKENINTEGHLSKSSLILGSGCVQPAATFEYEITEDGTYFLSFFGKVIEDNQSANVIFSNSSLLSEMRTVDLKANEWKAYQSQSLQFKKGDKVKIEFIVGGIIAVNTLIDHFKIYKAN